MVSDHAHHSPPIRNCSDPVDLQEKLMGALIHDGFSGHVEDISVIIDKAMEEGIPPIQRHILGTRFPGKVEKTAYRFDGNGNYNVKEWDLAEGQGSGFCWYHVQLPKGDESQLQLSKYLIDVLCPPLKTRDILCLIKTGSFCGLADGALIFRVTSADPAANSFTFKLAVRVTGNSVISVSQGRVPRLGFSSFKKPLLLEVPTLEPPNGQQGESSRFVIDEPTLQSFLSAKHSEEADYSVPRSVSDLLIHIIETHMVHLEDVVDKLGTDLDVLELDINAGDSERRQLLQDRSFAESQTKLQRILQVIAHAEQVLPQVKGICSSKQWFDDADVCFLEELIGRLRKLKENVTIVSKRAKTIQAGLDCWQSNQINRKLYCISLVTIVFLPLSLLTGVFGMNVGGIPWTSRKGHPEMEGFRNVILLCVILVIAMLVCYGFFKLRSRLSCGCGWKDSSRAVAQLEAIPEEIYGSIRVSRSPV